MGFMTIDMQTPCTKCGGKGKQPTKKCSHCRGLKVVKEAKKIELEIEAGMKNGDTIVFERQGEQVPDMIQGDIVFTIKQNTHPTFKRVGDNLYLNLDISLQEALLGFTKQIRHLDGHFVKVTSEGGEVAQPFSWKIIPGEGMPIRGSQQFGELHVKLIVGFPAKLSPTQKEMIEKIFPE